MPLHEACRASSRVPRLVADDNGVTRSADRLRGLDWLEIGDTVNNPNPGVHVFLRLFVLAPAIIFAACGGGLPPPTELTPTSDPLTRLIRNDAASVLRAGTTVLREAGFTVENPAPDGERIFSEPLLLQSNWRGQPISDRVLCGIGTSGATSDYTRLTNLANTIAIGLRLGYEVEPRAESTAVTVLFVAEGRRPATVVASTPTMSCTLTVSFVTELFRELESELRRSAE
jgi:hypothetical protein